MVSQDLKKKSKIQIELFPESFSEENVKLDFEKLILFCIVVVVCFSFTR